jgi:NTE family protein
MSAAEPAPRHPAVTETLQEPAVVRSGFANMIKLNLALQGGGAHGAFTWGVLDRLLEDEDIEIAAVSGTSAGAINAIVAVEGILEGGKAFARAQLDDFWRGVAEAARASPFKPLPFARDPRYDLTRSPLYLMGIAMMRAFSPYQLNPHNFNPLRDLLDKYIQYERLVGQDRIKLFINTTHVATGALRIFREHELNTDIVLASTTLPQLFQTPLIDGEGYWDGGYVANPAIEPMTEATDVRDVLVVQLNPLVRENIPTATQEIFDRLNEIVFNASLLAELRRIAERNHLVESGELSADRHPVIRLHLVHGDGELAAYAGSSRLLADSGFLNELKALGRARMDRFLRRHKHEIGQTSSFDYARMMAHRFGKA